MPVASGRSKWVGEADQAGGGRTTHERLIEVMQEKKQGLGALASPSGRVHSLTAEDFLSVFVFVLYLCFVSVFVFCICVSIQQVQVADFIHSQQKTFSQPVFLSVSIFCICVLCLCIASISGRIHSLSEPRPHQSGHFHRQSSPSGPSPLLHGPHNF